MTTSDLRGPEGMTWVVPLHDGGGGGPGPRAPAMPVAGPGIGAAAAVPPVPGEDPLVLAAAIAKLANEVFAASMMPGSAEVAPAAPTAPAMSPGPSAPAMSSAPADPLSRWSPPDPALNPFSAEILPDFSALNAVVRVPLAHGAPMDLGAFESALRLPMLGEVEDLGSDLHLAPGATASPAPARGEQASSAPPNLFVTELRADPPDLAAGLRGVGGAFNPAAVRRDFPILEERVHGRPLVWLDSAATTQKPRAVIDRLAHFYAHENSNIHRAAHALAARATDAYEGARETVRRFLNAPSVKEIVFVRGATEGINLIAQSWGRRHVGPGDEVVITWLEHHANIVPWQQLCAEKGARLRVAPVDDRGQIILEELDRILGPRTKIVSFTQVSNALGTITPAREMVAMARRHGARVVIDGAQAVSHMRVDVQALDCDFYVFSGHKVFAPTGIGVVFGKAAVLEVTPPWQGGGNMIADVTFERTVYREPPARFEAGTGNIADAVGLGAALEYLSRLGIENVARYEHDLLGYATDRILTVPGIEIVGTAPDKAGVISFVLDGHRTEDIGAALDRRGIAVRSGHHCAQPILRRFGLESTVRASLAPYNTCEDIDALVGALLEIQGSRGR